MSSFDLDTYLRESTAASGVPERVEDAEVIREAVTLLLAMRATPLQFSPDRTAKTPRKRDRSRSSPPSVPGEQ